MSSASDNLDDWRAATDTHGGVVPSVTTLRKLSGITRSDAATLLQQWEEWPHDVVIATVGSLAEMSLTEPGIQFDELFAACLAHPLEDVRAQSVAAVTGNGDSRLIDLLSDLVQSDSSDEVRALAAAALGAYADPAEAGRISPQRVSRMRSILESATDDPSTQVAGAALVAFSGMPGGSATEAIQRNFDPDSEDSTALAFAYEAMGSSSERHWMPDVIDALDHPSPVVRESATKAYGDLADPDDDLAPLETLLDDEELAVQIAAVTALRTIGTSDARELLTYTITSTSEPDVRQRAQEAMDQLREDDDLHQAVTPEMMEYGLYGGGGTGTPTRDVGRYDAPTEEGWAGIGGADIGGTEEDIGEDMEDYYDSEEFWRG